MKLLPSTFQVCCAMVIVALLQSSGPSSDLAALKMQAEAGNAKAQVQLGEAFASGNGVPSNDVEAVKWFSKAAEKGDPAAEYSLGEMYMTGRGVAVNQVKGLDWIKRSAIAGEPRGQYNLAAMYATGQGVPKDLNEAAKWMRTAADQGSSDGQFGRGVMYAHGEGGLSQSASQAAEWYRKSANQGNLPAMNNLAFLLATTADVKVRNTKEAISFAQQAVQAAPDNGTLLDTLATTFFEDGQPEKAAEAERRAIDLKPENVSYRQALVKYLAASHHQ